MYNDEKNERKLGDLKRNFNRDENGLKELHDALLKHVNEQIIYDERARKGPYVRNLIYTDFAGGIKIHTDNTDVNVNLVLETFYNVYERWLSSDKTGVRLFEENYTFNDKYQLEETSNVAFPEKLIILPGSNYILPKEKSEALVDFSHIDFLVEQDFKIKPHPLTSPEHIQSLERMFGVRNVLPSKNLLHVYYENASVVACTSANEYMLKTCIDHKKMIDIGLSRLSEGTILGDFIIALKLFKATINYENDINDLDLNAMLANTYLSNLVDRVPFENKATRSGFLNPYRDIEDNMETVDRYLRSANLI